MRNRLGPMGLLAFCAGLAVVVPAFAAGPEDELIERKWSFDGPLGTFDRHSLQRGFQVYKEVCHNCHGLEYMALRNLEGLGYNADEVKALAAQFEVQDGPNDEGEMFTRPARPSDHMPSPFPNPQTARLANGGALPPDLSLITKAREGGPDYVYSLLNGYQDAPEGVEPQEGMYYNVYFPGHWIGMPPPLSDDQVTYDDGTSATLDQMSADVTQFLAYIAEPTLEDRKRTGLRSMLFLVTLAGIFFAYKRKVWSDLH